MVVPVVVPAGAYKPIVDAIKGLAKAGRGVRIKSHAEAAIREAIRELLLVNPNTNVAAAKIAIAKAAGILSEDVLVAEDMLERVRAHKIGAKKAARKRAAKKPARKRAAKKTARKRAAKKSI